MGITPPKHPRCAQGRERAGRWSASEEDYSWLLLLETRAVDGVAADGAWVLRVAPGQRRPAQPFAARSAARKDGAAKCCDMDGGTREGSTMSAMKLHRAFEKRGVGMTRVGTAQ